MFARKTKKFISKAQLIYIIRFLGSTGRKGMGLEDRINSRVNIEIDKAEEEKEQIRLITERLIQKRSDLIERRKAHMLQWIDLSDQFLISWLVETKDDLSDVSGFVVTVNYQNVSVSIRACENLLLNNRHLLRYPKEITKRERMSWFLTDSLVLSSSAPCFLHENRWKVRVMGSAIRKWNWPRVCSSGAETLAAIEDAFTEELSKRGR